MNYNTYKLLVVDDDKVIHQITDLVLKEVQFLDFELIVLNAYSAENAIKILKTNKDIAVALIDVNMETSTSGLDLVNYIRSELNNKFIRLVIRTSEISKYPAREVIQKYDINDYIKKSKIDKDRLFTSVRSSVKQYIQLIELDNKYKDTYKKMTTNAVTMLPNRIKFYEESICEKNRTLILIDIVSFGTINEIGGYSLGDFVLKELAGFLQAMYSGDFYVYHFDNDLFALITKDDFSDNIFEIVNKIKDDISKLNIITSNFNHTIDTTIGVAYHSDDNLIKKAELALKEARLNGKNQIKYYSDNMKVIKSLNEVKKWAPRLRDGIKNGQLKAFYQPIYDLKSNKIEKYELLMRLEHNNELHVPIKFLLAAKESGQLYDIFKIMFKNACMQASNTSNKFSINIGDSEFKQDGIVDYIKETINYYNVNPIQLSLEILEYNSIASESEIIDTIYKIHDLGVEIVIDDFGVECSNFGQIESLPIDVIKIDGSFIEDLPTSINSQIIVKTIKTFAKEKNIKLVAEFICNKDVLDAVKKYDIEYGQGFYLGMPSADIESFSK